MDAMVFRLVREEHDTEVPHYYGNLVRQLLILAAGVMFVAAPWYTNDLRVELPFILAGILVVVILAALINPHSKRIAAACAVASGVGMLIFGSWALFSFKFEYATWVALGLRELLALLFLGAFYFSMKTFRAMMLGKVGRKDVVGEFFPDERE